MSFNPAGNVLIVSQITEDAITAFPVDEDGTLGEAVENEPMVDVLPAEEYEAEHIAGALSIPLKTLDRQTTARLDRNRPVIVYCWDYQ